MRSVPHICELVSMPMRSVNSSGNPAAQRLAGVPNQLRVCQEAVGRPMHDDLATGPRVMRWVLTGWSSLVRYRVDAVPGLKSCQTAAVLVQTVLV
jgi:hypothetical protein